jgi:hypothetical protein
MSWTLKPGYAWFSSANGIGTTGKRNSRIGSAASTETGYSSFAADAYTRVPDVLAVTATVLKSRIENRGG